MIRAFLLSIGQLGDPAILRVLAKTLVITLAIFALIAVGLWSALNAVLDAWGSTAGAAAAIGAIAMTLLAGWLLFRVVAIAVVGVFGDEVVEAVEARHYADALANARPTGFADGVTMGLASAARAVAINLLMVPVYLFLLITGVGTAIAFAGVNGWLLGRDLGEMVAVRHMPRPAVRDWLAATRGRRFLLGLVVTGLFVVPVVNLLAPIIGAAMATHLFHARRDA